MTVQLLLKLEYLKIKVVLDLKLSDVVFILSPYRSQECVKGQNISIHGFICFILIKGYVH